MSCDLTDLPFDRDPVARQGPIRRILDAPGTSRKRTDDLVLPFEQVVLGHLGRAAHAALLCVCITFPVGTSTAIVATSLPVRPDALGHVAAEAYSARLVDRFPMSAERREAKTHRAEQADTEYECSDQDFEECKTVRLSRRAIPLR